MAQCVDKADKRPADLCSADVVTQVEESQPKKMRQARLPFQPLDCKTPSSSPAGTNPKKRKLSGQDSPNSKPKHAKHLLSSFNPAEKEKVSLENENEVSSSSEAETTSGSSGKTRPTKNNVLERFVQRQSLQDEITSTNDVIDLTESQEKITEQDENSPIKQKSPTKSAKKAQAQLLEKSAGAKQKGEDGFARKLNFDESAESSPATVSKEEVDTKCSKTKTAERAEKEIETAEDAEPTGTDQSEEDQNADVSHDGEADNNENDNSALDDMDSSGQNKNEDCHLGTPSMKKPLSCSTPRTPAADTSCSSIDGSTPSSAKKRARRSTGKQADKTALRKKVKEEKERQKREEKEKKEKERLEKKQKRDEEKAEKMRLKQEEKEKKDKERQEKKEQLEKEKQEKEKKKEEEKKKKQELLDAKQEEKKKKEEEKRLKEEEKQRDEEEKERQKLKRKEVFESFFIKPKAVTTTKVVKAADSMFIPFEVKEDMSLAPHHRRSPLTDQEKDQLDKALMGQAPDVTYLQNLKKAAFRPVRTGRRLRTKKEAEEEVELLVHDSETVKKVMHAVKLLQFHTDYRPPYYGTWRKPVKHVSPRNPWKKDEGFFDYEVDSDEEWEEEEPGESLSDFNDEDEEADAGEEEDDDGWMVPHGYLSEDEGCDDDEEVTPEVLKARQRAKAQAWEAELQAKKQVAPPVHVGCYWETLSTLCQKDLDILKQFEMVCFRVLPLETQLSSPAMTETLDKGQDKTSGATTPSTKGYRKRAVPEEAMTDLIRLLHGNSYGIKKLVREFRLYWKRKTMDPNTSLNESRVDEEEPMDTSCVDTSVAGDPAKEETALEGEAKECVSEKGNTEKPDKDDKSAAEKIEDGKDDEADDNFSISKRQLELKILAIAAREKRAGTNKKCWYVSDDFLQQYNMADLSTENSWEYISRDMTKKTPSKSAEKKSAKGMEKKAAGIGVDEKPADVEEADEQAERVKKAGVVKPPKDQPSIMGFTCKVTEKPEAGAQLLESSAPKPNTPSKAALKPDQPSVMAFLRKTPAKKAASNEETKTASAVETPMEEECIVLD